MSKTPTRNPILVARRIKEKEARKQKILNVAEKIVISHGYEALNIRDIANGISFSLPVIYTHFKNKDEIVSALKTRLQEDPVLTSFSQYIIVNKEIINFVDYLHEFKTTKVGRIFELERIAVLISQLLKEKKVEPLPA